MLATMIGTLAAIFSVISFAPQAWRIIRTRETKGLSVKTYILTSTGFMLWLAFGILKGEWPIIIPNFLCLLFALFISVMLILPKRQREKVADTLDPNPG
jgi:MtN3 and saliva related transmembrane protein